MLYDDLMLLGDEEQQHQKGWQKMDLEQVYAASAARLRPYQQRVAQRNEVGAEEQHVLSQDDVRTWRARYGNDVTRWPVYGQAADLGRQVEDMDEPVISHEIAQRLPHLTLVPVPSAQSLVEEYLQHAGAAATVKGLCWYVLCTRSNYHALFGSLYDTFADNDLYQFDPWEAGNACGPMHVLMHELCAVVVRAYGLESLVTTMDNPDDLELDLLLEEFAGTVTSGSLVHSGKAPVRLLAHTATVPDAAPYATDEIDAWISDHAEHAAQIGAELEVYAEQLGD
jgi:hypothetical protein